MITPQQAAAMSPGQARKLCVALSASLSSMAAGMSRLGEENAGWLMAMRRAASVARTSGRDCRLFTIPLIGSGKSV